MRAQPQLVPTQCGCCEGDQHWTPPGGRLSRRGILTAGIAGAAAWASTRAILPRTASAAEALSPDAALQALVDGNARFVAKNLLSFNEDLGILKNNTIASQAPFAAVLSCADSRVPVELVFDQSIGHLFVARVAGNLATSEIIASLEYGAQVLGTSAIMVLGHNNCGAISAAIAGNEVPGQISDLFAMLRPAVEQSGGNAELAVKDNAKIQANLLATASPVLATLIKRKALKVVAAYYALDTGRVTILD